MNFSKKTMMKNGLLVLLMLIFYSAPSMAQDNSDNTYEQINFSVTGGINVVTSEPQNKTTVVIKVEVTDNNTGASETITETVEVEGTDADSKEEASEKASENLWEKIKNFFGLKSKGKGVMLHPDGKGDYRPWGSSTITLSLKGDGGAMRTNLKYGTYKQIESRFASDLSRQIMKM